MLFDPARHEPLAGAAWDEGRARETIERIASASVERFTPEGLWPVHPLDDDQGQRPPPRKALYVGAAGTIWALDWLARAGAIPARRDFAGDVAPLLEANRREMAPGAADLPSYLMGDAGILLLDWKLSRSPPLLDALARAIASNARNPARELMWGAPGTMLAALFLHESSGEPRWAELFRESASVLFGELEPEDETGGWLWTQDLYGSKVRFLGAVHGFVGNVLPVVNGRHLLAPEAWRAWSERIVATVAATALREGALANWALRLGAPRPGQTAALVHHCHGAPGIVNSLADFPDAGLDDLLVAAGELTFAAGPLCKGSNLCHGTAGNGLAFLKLFRRTGDERWLERARAFAMHAIAQCERHRAEYGDFRFNLWTGDLGLAHYLWSCVAARDRFPTVDEF